MKQIAKIIIAMLLLLVLVACGGATPEAEPQPEEEVGQPEAEAPAEPEESDGALGLSLSTLNNPFFVTLADGAQAAADAAGVELVIVDAQDDPAQEATNIEDLIEQGVSALLINPTDADAIVPSIQKANEAGIPVFTIDRGASGGEVVAHIASDNVAGGSMAGAFLCDAIGGSGKVVELEGIAGTSAARDRGQGFNDYMSGECAGVEIIAQQTANFNRAEGLSVFENILQAEPEIDGVFAHNDEMILGAIEAAKAAGRDAEIVFVGFDAVDDAVAAVEAGDLAATVAQQPAVMGQLGVETALASLDGQSVDAFTPVDLALVAGEGVAVEAPEGLTFGLSLSTLNNPFFVTLADGAQAAADAAGVELIIVDAQDDPAQEATNMEDLIQRGVSAILVNPTDADAIVPSIQKANEAGIPVFTIDRGASGGEVVAHIASDNVAGGSMAGAFLCDAIGGSGKVVELEGIAGTSAARDRGQGFNDYMSSECAGVEIIAQQTANFNRAEGLSVFENILQAEPEIDGVFAHNDEMILGAIEAAKAAGRDAEIVFVGFDAVDDAVAAVEAGDLAATIAQQPAVMGQLGVETAAAFLGGTDVDDYTPVDLALVAGEVSAAGPMGDYVLGLSLSTLNNPFFVTLADGAQAAADAAGSELIIVDAQDDPAQEATNMEDLIQRGVDAILVNPTDADAIVPSIQKANEAGIPVFTIDRGAAGGEVVAHIASDNVAGGSMAGAFLCDAIGGSGKVVELEGIAGTSAARDRGQGFNDYMSGECAGVEIIAQQTANFNRAEGLSVFENILQAEPEIDGVFAHNDEMILGAIEAAKAAGRDAEIVFVGFDAVDDAVAAVEAGDLAATIAQQPAVMGQLGVDTAVIFLNGDSVEPFTGVDLSLVN